MGVRDRARSALHPQLQHLSVTTDVHTDEWTRCGKLRTGWTIRSMGSSRMS